MHKGGLLCFFFLFWGISSSFSQLNFKVGYGLSYQNMEVTNQALRSYNEQRPWLDKNFKDLQFFQSIILGLRYQWDFVALDLTWQKGFNRKKVEGLDPSTNANFSEVLGFNFDRYSIGYENYYQNLGIGASFDYNRYQVKAETVATGKRSLVSEQNFSSIFHLSYTFSNNSALKFMIKPYIQVPWTKIKLDGLVEDFDQDPSQEDFTEDTMSYGLMLIFYQGN